MRYVKRKNSRPHHFSQRRRVLTPDRSASESEADRELAKSSSAIARNIEEYPIERKAKIVEGIAGALLGLIAAALIIQIIKVYG